MRCNYYNCKKLVELWSRNIIDETPLYSQDKWNYLSVLKNKLVTPPTVLNQLFSNQILIIYSEHFTYKNLKTDTFIEKNMIKMLDHIFLNKIYFFQRYLMLKSVKIVQLHMFEI